MAVISIPRFYSSEAECEAFGDRVKLVACPHCHRVGNLNRHGYLRGAEEGCCDDKQRRTRGRRFYCNKRGQASGCGQTFSILDCAYLIGWAVTSAVVWLFLCAFARDPVARRAFRATGSRMNERAGSRLLARIRSRHSEMRATLLRECSIPEPPAESEPLAHVTAHLLAAFVGSACPVAAFQQRFQQSFL